MESVFLKKKRIRKRKTRASGNVGIRCREEVNRIPKRSGKGESSTRAVSRVREPRDCGGSKICRRGCFKKRKRIGHLMCRNASTGNFGKLGFK